MSEKKTESSLRADGFHVEMVLPHTTLEKGMTAGPAGTILPAGFTPIAGGSPGTPVPAPVPAATAAPKGDGQGK